MNDARAKGLCLLMFSIYRDICKYVQQDISFLSREKVFSLPQFQLHYE